MGYSPWGCKELDMTELTKHSTGRYNELVTQSHRSEEQPPSFSPEGKADRGPSTSQGC